MDTSEHELYGHRVVVMPDDNDADHASITIDGRPFAVSRDDELGWTCGALPFRGYGSPLAVARGLAASMTAGEEEG